MYSVALAVLVGVIMKYGIFVEKFRCMAWGTYSASTVINDHRKINVQCGSCCAGGDYGVRYIHCKN